MWPHSLILLTQILVINNKYWWILNKYKRLLVYSSNDIHFLVNRIHSNVLVCEKALFSSGEYGMSHRRRWLGLVNYNSVEDRAAVGFICRYPFIKWVAMTWKRQGTKIRVLAMQHTSHTHSSCIKDDVFIKRHPDAFRHLVIRYHNIVLVMATSLVDTHIDCPVTNPRGNFTVSCMNRDKKRPF